MSALAVEDVAISFGGVAAVAGVSFAVEQGEIFAIIGPNGAGKTTLFNLIAGNYCPSRGRVTLDGDDVTGLTRTCWHGAASRARSRICKSSFA